MYDAMHDDEPGALDGVVTKSTWSGIDVIPGHKAISMLDTQNLVAPQHRLSNAAAGALEDYDVVLIDLPPQLGLIPINGLVLADWYYAVTMPEAWSFDGIGEYIETASQVQRSRLLNPDLRFGGAILNAYEDRRTEHRERWAELKETYPGEVFEVRIPRLAAAAGMAAFGESLYEARGAAGVASLPATRWWPR
ncbi:ParA family protein [Oerskovia sp. M15]